MWMLRWEPTDNVSRSIVESGFTHADAEEFVRRYSAAAVWGAYKVFVSAV